MLLVWEFFLLCDVSEYVIIVYCIDYNDFILVYVIRNLYVNIFNYF